MKLSNIKPNPNNPRLIKDDRFAKLVNSIKEFPKMMDLRPIVVDNNNTILGGNMRYKALKELGYKEIPDTWIKRADDLTVDEQRRFIAVDNVGFGEWEWGIIANEWNTEELIKWGVEIPSWDKSEDIEIKDISDKLKVEYKIEITCTTEYEQEQLYNELIEKGIECRILTL